MPKTRKQMIWGSRSSQNCSYAGKSLLPGSDFGKGVLVREMMTWNELVGFGHDEDTLGLIFKYLKGRVE